MTLEELLAREGLDARAIEEAVAWAKRRALELVAEIEPGSELARLLNGFAHPDPEALVRRPEHPGQSEPRERAFGRTREAGPIESTAVDRTQTVDRHEAEKPGGARPGAQGAPDDVEELDDGELLELEEDAIELVEEDRMEAHPTEHAEDEHDHENTRVRAVEPAPSGADSLDVDLSDLDDL